MALLFVLTTLVLLTAVAVTKDVASRAEAVVTGSLAFNALIIGPIYLLGFLRHLDRLTLLVSLRSGV